MGVTRKTKAVSIVISIFEDNKVAYSVVHLIELLKDKMNKTTVYRVLNRLEQDGVIHSFTGKEGLKWYAKCESCSSHSHDDVHPHFQCVTCDKVECLPMYMEIPSFKNRRIDSANILLTGQCEGCSV